MNKTPLKAATAVAVMLMLTPRCEAQRVFASAPDNAEMILDRNNKTWISPPCMLADNFERATRGRLDTFMDEQHDLNGRNQWSIREILARGVLEKSTMAEAHALQKKDPKWAPDSVCNSAGGFLDERTVWGWLTSRPSRWTPDGQWRW